MTIETTRAPEGVKPASSAASRGASAASRPGAVGAPGAAGVGGGGFAGLMSLLSVPDTAVAPLAADQPVSDTVMTRPVPAEDKEKNMPLALDGQGLIAMNLMPDVLPAVTPAMVPTVPTQATALLTANGAPMAFLQTPAPADASPSSLIAPKPEAVSSLTPAPDAVVSLPFNQSVAVVAADPAAPAANVEGVNLTGQRTLAPSHSGARSQFEPKDVAAQSVNPSVLAAPDRYRPEPAILNTDVVTLLDHRRASQSHAAAQTQLEVRDARMLPASAQVLAAQEASRAAPVLLAADAMPGLTDRREGRPGAGPTRTGLEGALGGTVADRLGINASYEVAAASAVVPEGQVAETVSYWASHGVQSAELTLDGLGDEPVEVRISVEGDQAQIDFRSNQPEVRQALEGASAQLKALLSGEGLQLTGMSVGTSGRGSAQGEGGQPKPSSRQTKLVSVEPPRSSTARPANPAVGQALDLYV